MGGHGGRGGVTLATCCTVDVEFAPATRCLFDQCCNSVWKPLPQAEWIKVSDREPDMFDIAPLLATVNDWVDV